MFEYVDQTNYTYKVADINLAPEGANTLKAAEDANADIIAASDNLKESKPLKGKRITCCVEINARSVFFVKALVSLGATVRVCANGTTSTDNGLAALLAKDEISVFAWRGESLAEFWWCARKSLDFADKACPDYVVDEGGRLSLLLSRGVEFSDNTELYSQDYSEADEDTLELVEILRMVRGHVDWHRMAQSVSKTVSEVSADGLKQLL